MSTSLDTFSKILSILGFICNVAICIYFYECMKSLISTGELKGPLEVALGAFVMLLVFIGGTWLFHTCMDLFIRILIKE